VFNVPAATLKEYFAYDPLRKADLEKLDRFVRATAPALTRYFHAGTPAAGKDVEWPVIGVALQKNYISVYLAVRRKADPLVSCFSKSLDFKSNGLRVPSAPQVARPVLTRGWGWKRYREWKATTSQVREGVET